MKPADRRDTINCLLSGFNDREAAEMLGITRSSLSNRVSVLKDELGANTRIHLGAILAAQYPLTPIHRSAQNARQDGGAPEKHGHLVGAHAGLQPSPL